MAESATARKLTWPGASFARRYGLAFASVVGALLLDLLFHHFNLPHPFAAFALSAIAITFWYGGTKPGIVAVLLSSLIRGFIFEGETNSLSRVLYQLVFLTFALLMIWVRRRREALEVAIVDRTAKLTAANEDLHRRKEQLDGLFELSPDAVILTDENFNVLRVNQEFTRVFGYTAEEVAGQWLPDLIVPEELRDESLKYRALLTSGERVELEVIRQRKDGVRFDVSVVARGISRGFDQVAVCLIYRDITERKNAERQLRRSEAYLAEAQRLSHTGSFGWSIPSGELFWSEETFQIFQYEQTKPPTVELIHQRVHPEDAALVKQTIGRASQDGKDFEHEYRLLMPDGSVKYVHALAHASWDKSGGIEFVGALSDVTPRKRAEEALRKSAERWRSVFENSAVGVALTDMDGRFLATNHVYQTMLGYTEEELRTLQFLDITHEDYREANWALIAELVEGKRRQFQIEKKYKRKDGSSIWVSNNVSLVPGTERVPRFIMALSEDITQRKRAEEALRRSEAYLAEGQRLAKTGSWAVDPKTEKCIYWSEEMRQIFGLDPQRSNLPDREEFLRLVHPEDRNRFNEQVDEALRAKADLVQDYRIVLPDGTVKHIHAIGHLVLDEAGNIIEGVGTDMDVTERKRAEEQLRRSEADLLEAQRISQTGSWKHDVLSGTVIVSPEMFRIFGVKPDEDTSTTEFWLSKNHPDDQKRIRELFERSEIEKTDYEADYRIVLTDGSIKHLHAVGHPVLNDSGDLVEFVGTAMDITERKQREDKIREHEVELRQILDAAPQHLSVLRGDGSHLYINQSSLDFLGLTLEAWQKRDIRELVHPDDAERVDRERKQALSSGSPLEFEARFLRYDGEYRWLFLHYKPLKDQLGRITRWVVPAIDIDDRKRSEERLHHENVALREEIVKASMFEEIVGASPALQTVLSSIVKVARTDSTVLITGETGTGKELIARALHKHSQRSGQAFISVNCASIPSSLIASELFGHEKGAFTGAVQRRQGRFELAHSGTIFLDEVGELPAETQIALLRVLQERQFERVGGNRTLTTDVRVIAATNRDLTAAIAAGTFRSDLFYRLNVFPIEVPPLRKRKEDIPMLVEYFVKRYAENAGKQIRTIDVNTLELCQSYPWPGNIRELQNIVERSVILSSGDTFWIEKAWLASPEPARQEWPSPLADTLQNQEREIIEIALAECKGKVAGPEGAAAKLRIPRSTLDSKIKQLKIKKHKFVSE
jgi:formate hydrogenlyase transcriptional activator